MIGEAVNGSRGERFESVTHLTRFDVLDDELIAPTVKLQTQAPREYESLQIRRTLVAGVVPYGC